MWDAIWTGARLATMTTGGAPYGAIGTADDPAAIAVAGDRIAWTGRVSELPGAPETLAHAVHDAGGRWITPGLIDAHTHLVYGGDRAHEFELRLNGASYEEIARAGGGIRSTVTATRAATEEELVASADRRLAALCAEGVTVVEVKSGYGLDLDNELKMLRAARRLEERRPVTVRTTLLAAHAVPPEYQGRPDAYIDEVCHRILPAAAEAGLADAVDAFCEGIGFTPAQTERVFQAASRHGLPVKLHAEQLSDLGGAALAARFGALSADHLEYLSEDGVKAMAEAGTVAMLLPGAFYCLRETKLPPIDALRRYGVPIAVSTDCNPGTSPISSLLTVLNMACVLFRLTPEEALAGATRNAARALGLQESHGTLEPGKAADFALWDIDRPAELSYRIGPNPCAGVVKAGRPVA
ncbi:imidazolonepropionase [Azospirillum sp. RWY-5-1]|uniref:Imidazolonepropionase n=1 Tax=Azospirillum oleiclasticum TaxID=2735135 RepID=A0ABX2T2U8_9PROT|nr:imidazolonepropionase [Azospirillum oleiclasticum]NYZ11226.1 imidazolonepropionase [Azospirillum oleiclasticum]NYZ18387.1 imidazolonepropionase [Azospirillum oleiclasticum]